MNRAKFLIHPGLRANGLHCTRPLVVALYDYYTPKDTGAQVFSLHTTIPPRFTINHSVLS